VRSYLLKRILWMFPTLVGITLLTFGIMQLVPGDPGDMLFATPGVDAPTDSGNVEEALVRFRHENLLDQPLWRQYLHYVGPFDLSEEGHVWFGGSGQTPFGGLVLGDLGREFSRPHVTIMDELLKRLQVTVPLALLALVLSYLLALPLGIYSVMRQGSFFDVGAGVFVFLLYAVPAFWAGLMLQLMFGSHWLDLLPIVGLHDQDADSFSFAGRSWDLLLHLVLPIVTLSYGGFAYLSRQMRSGLLDVIREDYIRTARAKGLSERTVVLKHALRNALGPVLTLFATILPGLIGGALIVEVVFDLPGIGRYAYEGLEQRDYFIVMGTTTFSAVVTLVCVLLTDLAYAWIDPRVRYG
jgi:peptide/nickel transport system permease protein